MLAPSILCPMWAHLCTWAGPYRGLFQPLYWIFPINTRLSCKFPSPLGEGSRFSFYFVFSMIVSFSTLMEVPIWPCISTFSFPLSSSSSYPSCETKHIPSTPPLSPSFVSCLLLCLTELLNASFYHYP